MIIPSWERHDAEQRAVRLTLAIAAKAGWATDDVKHIWKAPFATGMLIDAPGILLVSTIAGLPFVSRKMSPVAHAGGLDVLIAASPIRAEGGFAVGIYAEDCTTWDMPLAPWLEPDGALWLVPEPDSPRPFGFRLGNYRHFAEPPPWRDAAGYQVGRTRAAAWLKSTEGGAEQI